MVEERNEADGGACWSDGLMRHDLVFVGCVVVCIEEINFMFFVAFLWQTIGPFTQDCRWFCHQLFGICYVLTYLLLKVMYT